MNNLSIIQEAWLGVGAGNADAGINLIASRVVSIDPPEPGFPGWFVQTLCGHPGTFETFAEALDFASDLLRE